MTWRQEARSALRAYPRIKSKEHRVREVHIIPSYGEHKGGYSSTRPTEAAALSVELSPYEQRVINAVDFVMKMQGTYGNTEERQRFIRLVYFLQSHTIEGAALECHCSRELCMKWNTEILSAVYICMEFQKRQGLAS